MAAEEVDYESDPEETKLSLKMRRRVASDDEDEVEGREKPPRRIDSDVESDGEGAAPAEYDDGEEEEVEEEVEEEEYLEEEEELEEEGEYEEEGVEHEGEGEGRAPLDSQEVERVVEGEGGKEGGGERLRREDSREADGMGNGGVNEKGDDGMNNQQQGEEGEKKENEPYAVPTAGAFYMHDDRFRDNAGGRNRRTLGGRKLWESKDDRKWGHDKFEELTLQERHHEEGRRSSRGRFRGRARSRGALRGYSQGNRPKTYGNNNNQNNNDDQNNAPKSVRGRGPRRYQPSFKNNNDAPQNKQFGKSVEKPSRISSGRATVPNSDVESGTIPSKKQVFASSLNSASPPFYPSSSSNKEITFTQKRDVQAGTVDRNVQAPVVDENFPMAQSNTMLRGKNIVDSIGADKLYIDDSTSGVAGKPSTTLQFAPSGSSSVNSSQSQHLRAQGRGLNTLPRTTYQPTAASNLVNRVSPPTQLHAVQRNFVQSRVQPPMQASSQQFAQRPGSVSQASSPPSAAVPIDSLESGELESPSESSKSKTALVGKGKVNVQGSGRGPFLYGGTQVMGPSGNMNTGHGDKNFPAAPTFLPVMQLGGQHPGGIGVPAVGMAFPGYVGNPQLGLGNSEMTWLPVLAGAAGALGATYCSPYIAVDGAYHARPSGQAPALTAASSKENNTNKPNNEWKPSQRPEHANDDFGQRQKNPRRYTEMKFDQ